MISGERYKHFALLFSGAKLTSPPYERKSSRNCATIKCSVFPLQLWIGYSHPILIFATFTSGQKSHYCCAYLSQDVFFFVNSTDIISQVREPALQYSFSPYHFPVFQKCDIVPSAISIHSLLCSLGKRQPDAPTICPRETILIFREIWSHDERERRVRIVSLSDEITIYDSSGENSAHTI